MVTPLRSPQVRSRDLKQVIYSLKSAAANANEMMHAPRSMIHVPSACAKMSLLSLLLLRTGSVSEAFFTSVVSCRQRLTVSSKLTGLFETKNTPRHDVGGSERTELPEEVQRAMMEYQAHQQAAPKLGHAVDVRTLVQYNHGFAVMSAFSKSNPGYPSGSVVGFAPDEQGRPLFIFSGMSTHTQDLLVNPKCSLTVAAKDFKGAADGRVNLMGTCTLIKDASEREEAKEVYMKKHPGAFWADFGDFNWFRMEVEHCRFVGGFARAGTVSAAEYATAKPDAIAEFGPAIAAHMNDEHMDATVAIVRSSVPGMDQADNPVSEALITSVDSLGMYVKVTRAAPAAFLPQQFKLRLPFPRPAQDRKDVKNFIVEMTQQAAVTSSSSSEKV